MKWLQINLLCGSLALSGAAALAQARVPKPLAALSWALSVPQQTPASGVNVTGFVDDPAGDVIAAAQVTLKPKTGGAVRQTVADATGRFAFSNVAPGAYTLKAAAPNFQAAEVKLTISDKPQHAVRLSLALSVSEEITVNSRDDTPAATQNRNADRVSLDDSLLRGLPAAGQDVLEVIGNFAAPAALGGEGLTIVVDGVETDGFSVPANAIERLRINRNPYAAEYRRAGRARVEVTTEDGSYRRFHGGAALLARNAVFDARNAFARVKPDLNRQLFDWNFNGPLSRRRAAFFISGDRLRNDESAIINARTLTGPLVENILTPARRTRLFGRVDVRLNDRHKLLAHYNLTDESARNRGVGGFQLAAQAYDTRERHQQLRLSEQAVLSTRWLNDARFVWRRSTEQNGTLANTPELAVTGAFTAGPAQNFSAQRTTSLTWQDTASYYRDKHTVRFGGEAHAQWFDVTDASNFGGTFRFAGLEQFAAGQPYVYRINRGTPRVTFARREAAAFAQDEWKPRAQLSLSYGVRYGWQLNLPATLAPRFGFAYAPGSGKTVVRGGAGLFYERVPSSVFERSLLYDGVRLQQLVIADPAYPDPFAGGQITQTPPSVTRLDPHLAAPRVTQASLGVEREIGRRAVVTVEYQTVRGKRLLRSRNLNAPLPGAKQRPDARFTNVNQIEASAQSKAHALTVGFRGRLTRRFEVLAQYTLGAARNDTGGRFDLPANNYDLRPEWGRADYDQRQRFNLIGMLNLPHGVRVGTVWTLSSGKPFDITTGRDDNGDTLANDRPAGGTRNTGQGPDYARIDARVAKSFRLPHPFEHGVDGRASFLEFSVDVFNLFNHLNPHSYIGAQTSPFFGRANGAFQARTVQVATRYRF